MNQKRITNQILKQELSLNSTLNYLFNISNMKKLFSYLLISSMVVLSSCTNYDDQFDDLKTQITTLKGQIDGFSSLSAGLTQLQGTVASLQTAVNALPTTTTDISGLESDLASLATAVEALQAALANAATADEVAALATDLAAAQTDLTELLSQNNIYATPVSITSVAELDFAVALGDKLTIVNSTVTINQTTDMDAAVLADVMNKMTSVTGNVAYTATATSTTPGTFTNLTGSANLTINQSGDISLPALETAQAVSITGDNTTTSVSIPLLNKPTGLTFSGLGKVTSFSMPALEAFDGNLTIEIANAGTVDLSAFTNSTNADGTADNAPDDLTVNAATLTAPVYTAGKITADRLINVDLPMWKFDNASSFARAETVVLPSVNNAKAAAYEININTVFPKAESVHFIAAASTATTPTHLDVTTGGSDNLETLILGGTWDAVTVNGTDVVSLTFDGTAKTVSISSTDIAALDIPYTSATGGSLSITNNLDLESATAASVNGLKTLSITGNTELETVSFAALDTAAAAAAVTITGNKFAGVVTYTNTAATAGTLASASGLKEMKAFLDSAISGRTGTVAMQVELDEATTISSTNVETTPSGTYYLVDLKDQVSTGGADAVALTRAYTLATNGSGNLQIAIGSDNLYVDSSGASAPITPSANVALAIAELKSSAAVARASALGLNLDVQEGANVQSVTVSFTLATNSTTGESADAGATVSTTLLGTDDYATLTIGSQSVTATSGSSSASSTDGIATALASAWSTKYGVASTLYTLSASSGIITISVSSTTGNRAHNDAVSVSTTAGTDTSTTPLLEYVIGATNATTDNSLKGNQLVILLENTTAGVTGVTSPTISLSGTLTVSSTLASTDDHTDALATGYLGNVFPNDARGLAINAWDGTSLNVTDAAKTTDRTAFL